MGRKDTVGVEVDVGDTDGFNLNDGAEEEEGSRDGLPLVGSEDEDSLMATEGFNDGVKLGSMVRETDKEVTLTPVAF